MTAYYEEMTELWEARKFFDAIERFSQRIRERSLSRGEIESFKGNLATFWELVEAECEKNPEVLFSLYQTLKSARNWDDEMLCKELRIDKKAIEDIKNRHKPRSEGVGLKILYELFPEMAV